MLAGNGDGGGGSGNSGKNGKGKKGAGTGEGDEDAGEGGENACGAAGGGSCSGCSGSPTAGDPVDIASGRVVASAVDMFLPGPVNLEFRRTYKSGSALEDYGLGNGWTHPFSWRLRVKGKHVLLTDTAGSESRFPLPPEGGAAQLGKSLLVRTKAGFVLHTGDGFLVDFRPLPAEPKRYVLAIVHGPSSNKIRLTYDDAGRLRTIVDSAGRTVSLETDTAGRIVSLRVAEPTTGHAIVFATYRYDVAGNLVSVRNADGHETHYTYNDRGWLSSLRHPSSLTFHYVYDQHGHCIESWGDYPDGRYDPALDPALPPMLADGTTPAKGLFHVRLQLTDEGYREVVTTSEVQHYFTDGAGHVVKAVGNGGVTTRAYDDDGRVSATTNRSGATTLYERSDGGRLVRETNALGQTVTFEYDSDGHIVATTDAQGGVVRTLRTADGFLEQIVDQLGSATTYALDERGLIRRIVHAHGATSAYEVDAHGNCTAALLPQGETWRYRFDWWGRMVERVDPRGAATRYTWTDGGLLTAVYHPDGSASLQRHDPMGNVIELVEPDGSSETREYNGLDWQWKVVRSNGDVVERRFDREGRTVAFINERGEVNRWQWTATGVTRVVHYDGLEEHRSYNAYGSLERFESGPHRITITRDVLERPVEVEFGDGTIDTYEFDALGNLTTIAGPDCVVKYERNAVGEVVREIVEHDGDTTLVETTYQEAGARAAIRSSLGHRLELQQNELLRPRTLRLDGSTLLEFDYDPGGRVRAMSLPGGAAILSDWDDMRRLRRRTVVSPTAAPDGEPIWVGGSPRGVVLDKRYRWSERHLLLEATSNERTTAYEYDRRERLLARKPQSGAAELFAHDPTSNLFERGTNAPPREYGPRNVLKRRGDTVFVHDEAGFLIEKRIAREGGEAVWTYEWDARRNLAAVERPDGVRVAFAYDPLMRRVSKRVLTPAPATSTERILRQSTRYVWDSTRLLHEIVTTYDDARGVTGKTERTYAYHEGFDRIPIAEGTRDATAPDAPRRWVYFAGDMAGTPEEIVSGDGTILSRLSRTAFGRTEVEGSTWTPVRFPGQYEDPETGLHYNFMRYYDPEVGRYISPDPIELEGDWNEYVYCRNPISEIDPFGLHGLTWAIGNSTPTTIASGGAPVPVPGGATVSNPNPAPGCGWASLGGGCTERKVLTALNDPRNAAQMQRIRDGETLHMRGDYPPCRTCHRAMQEATANGGTVEYNFPVNQQVTYSNGTSASTGGAGATGQNTAGLVNMYNTGSRADGVAMYGAQRDVAAANAGGSVLWP